MLLNWLGSILRVSSVMSDKSTIAIILYARSCVLKRVTLDARNLSSYACLVRVYEEGCSVRTKILVLYGLKHLQYTSCMSSHSLLVRFLLCLQF